MPVTKRYEQSLHFAQPPSVVLEKVVEALNTAGFKKVSIDRGRWVVTGQRKPLVGTLWGDIAVSVAQAGDGTQILAVVNAAVDNVFTLANSPGQRLLALFSEALTPLVGSPQGFAPPQPGQRAGVPAAPLTTTPDGLASELERLADLHQRGVLNDDEFQAAKARALSISR